MMKEVEEGGHSHWILDGGRMVILLKYKCAKCGNRSAEKTRYCSYCGAKMDEVQSEKQS